MLRRAQAEEGAQQRQLLEGRRIVQGMTAYIRCHPPCTGALFDLLLACGQRSQVWACRICHDGNFNMAPKSCQNWGSVSATVWTACQSVCCQSVYLSICISVCLSLCLSVCWHSAAPWHLGASELAAAGCTVLPGQLP